MLAVARDFRKAPTPSEALLWQALRRRGLGGYKFRRQQPIGPFVVDFYCPAARLIIEIDGPVHEQQQAADAARQELIETLGLRFLRVPAALVEKQLDNVLMRIYKTIQTLQATDGTHIE